MPKVLTQIIYLSTAVELMSKDELQSLLKHSRESNEAKGISGILIYDDGNFIQVLEGEEEKLDNLLKIIHKDTRHKGVIEVNREQIEEREFAEWSMGFKRAEELKDAGFIDLLKLSKDERLNEFKNEGYAKSLIASHLLR